jgi:hypothetical protein
MGTSVAPGSRRIGDHGPVTPGVRPDVHGDPYDPDDANGEIMASPEHVEELDRGRDLFQPGAAQISGRRIS